MIRSTTQRHDWKSRWVWRGITIIFTMLVYFPKKSVLSLLQLVSLFPSTPRLRKNNVIQYFSIKSLVFMLSLSCFLSLKKLKMCATCLNLWWSAWCKDYFHFFHLNTHPHSMLPVIYLPVQQQQAEQRLNKKNTLCFSFRSKMRLYTKIWLLVCLDW